MCVLSSSSSAYLQFHVASILQVCAALAAASAEVRVEVVTIQSDRQRDRDAYWCGESAYRQLGAVATAEREGGCDSRSSRSRRVVGVGIT